MKVNTNFLEPIVRDYWINGSIYYNDGSVKTITDINLNPKNWSMKIKCLDGSCFDAFLDDYFDFDLSEDITRIEPNTKYLKKVNK